MAGALLLGGYAYFRSDELHENPEFRRHATYQWISPLGPLMTGFVTTGSIASYQRYEQKQLNETINPDIPLNAGMLVYAGTSLLTETLGTVLIERKLHMTGAQLDVSVSPSTVMLGVSGIY